MSVTIYSTPTCVYCKMVKKYFVSQNVQFSEVDVSRDREAAADLVKKSGQLGVPVIDIDGTIIVGFDKDKIDSLL